MRRIPVKAHLPVISAPPEWATMADDIPYSSQILNCEDARALQPPYPNRASIVANLMAQSVKIAIVAYAHVDPSSNAQSAPVKSTPSAKGHMAPHRPTNRAGRLR